MKAIHGGKAHGEGKALSILAHKLGRAARGTVFSMGKVVAA